MSASACMGGGWCAVRENCRHYHAEGAARLRPIERICEPAVRTAFEPVQHDAFEPVRRVVLLRREEVAA